MFAGADLATVVLIVIGIIVLLLAVDFLFAGGAMSGGMAGMMGGAMAGMSAGGWVPLLLLAIIGLLVYGFFLR